MSEIDWAAGTPGWRSLIEPLVKRCEEEGAVVLQVKEKFGKLRFYATAKEGARVAPSPELWEAIDAAERASGEICERCGAPGVLREYAWLVTLCDACDKQWVVPGLQGALNEAITKYGLDAATGALATMLGEILQRMDKTSATGVLLRLSKMMESPPPEE